MKNCRQQYMPKFKHRTLELIKERGKSMAQVAKENAALRPLFYCRQDIKKYWITVYHQLG